VNWIVIGFLVMAGQSVKPALTTVPATRLAADAASAVAAPATQAATPAHTGAQGEKAPPPGHAKEPDYPVVNVGVLSYMQYDAELKNRSGYNAFDVTRGYINITGDLMKNVRFRITPDLKRIADGSLAGSLTLRLKYGFAEFDNVGHAGSWLRFGLHQTPWLDFEEGINRYRVQGTMFAEREGLIPGSADFGVGYFMPLSSNYGEIRVGVYNGEGFAQAEANKYKSVQGRLTIRPFPNGGAVRGLRLSGFYDYGSYASGYPRRHGILFASFEHTNVVATAQWLKATDRPTNAPVDIDRSGYSTFLEVRQGLQGLAGFVRYDHFNPDTSRIGLEDRRTIAGVACWLTWAKARVGLVFNGEDVRYSANLGRPSENRLLAQTHVQF
jgi:hypothetical protein